MHSQGAYNDFLRCAEFVSFSVIFKLKESPSLFEQGHTLSRLCLARLMQFTLFLKKKKQNKKPYRDLKTLGEPVCNLLYPHVSAKYSFKVGILQHESWKNK